MTRWCFGCFTNRCDWRETGKRTPNVPKNGCKLKGGNVVDGTRFSLGFGILILFVLFYFSRKIRPIFPKSLTLQLVPRYMHNDQKGNVLRFHNIYSQFSILIGYKCFLFFPVFCVFAKAITLSSFRATGVYTPWLKWYSDRILFISFQRLLWWLRIHFS